MVNVERRKIDLGAQEKRGREMQLLTSEVFAVRGCSNLNTRSRGSLRSSTMLKLTPDNNSTIMNLRYE